MPDLDVIDTLYDPDFADVFDLYRFTTTSIDGISERVRVPPQIAISGVVQPAGNQSLKFLPEGEVQEGALDIWTVTRLNSGTRTQDADEIVYPTGNGDRYKVVSVTDWSRFALGFVKATCTLMEVNPMLVTAG